MKKIFIYFSTTLFFFLLGFGLCFLIFFKNEKKLDCASQYQAGWDSAKRRTIESGYYNDKDYDYEVRNLSGQIESIDNNNIIIKIKPLSPWADADLDKREIKITNETKIYQYLKKSEEEFQKILSNAKKTTEQRPDSNIILPSRYDLKDVPVSSLSIGQQITVEASNNIRDIKKFDANKITIESN
jgi:hypothetical protein